MTVVKQFGKLASPSLSFGNDTPIHNSNNGDADEMRGFNIPYEGSATWDGKAPFVHTDFWGEEPTIKPSGSWAFGCYHRTELQYPRVSALGSLTMRSQYETERNQTRIGFCFSIYVPTGGIVAQYKRRQVFQRWGGGSPSFAMYLDFEAGGKDYLSLRFYKTGANADLIYCPITRIEFNTWYHIIGFCDFRNDLNGRMTIWLDRSLARITPRIGSGEGVATYDRVPVVQNGTGSYQTNASLGQFISGNVTEGGFTQTLFDWQGYTVKPTDNPASGQWNWGLYPENSQYLNSQSTIIANLVDYPATKTWEECVLINPDNPLDADYLDPIYRTQEYYSNFTLAVWGEGQTDEDVFKELHPLGLAPLEFPLGEFAWPNGFIQNSPPIPPLIEDKFFARIEEPIV